MIINFNNRNNINSHPISQFDKFLRIRSQKQSIIHSQSETITQKIQGFQELLKLTKTGNSINFGNSIQNGKRHYRSFHKNQAGRPNNVNLIEIQTTNFNKFEQVQSDQAQLKKLNKMVSGFTQWTGQRQNASHTQKKICLAPKTCKLGKRVYRKTITSQLNRENGYNSINSIGRNQPKQNSHFSSQFQRKRTVYTCDQSSNNRFRKFNTIINKYSLLHNKQNNSMLKTSASLNFPQSLLKNNLFNENQGFKVLRQKIKILQNKAIKEYGLKFQNKKNIQNKDQQQIFINKQKKHNKQPNKWRQNKYKRIEEEDNDNDDDNIENDDKSNTNNHNNNEQMNQSHIFDNSHNNQENNLKATIHSQQKQSNHDEFKTLQLGAILLREQEKFKKQGYNNRFDSFLQQDKHHVYNDDTIPRGFIDIIKANNDSSHDKPFSNIKDILKKTSARKSAFNMNMGSKSQKNIMQGVYKYVRI